MTPAHEIPAPMHLAFLATCFNRRELTLASLAALYAQQPSPATTFTIYLVDDGSTDGTSEAVAAQYPDVRLLHGDGSLWWVGGMNVAFAAARADGFDAIVWFNDDTILFPDAVSRLVRCAREMRALHGPSIIAGSTQDIHTGLRSYGGFARLRSGLRQELVPLPPDPVKPVRCHTINGNFTLVPAEVVERLGNLDSSFLQLLADMDYGLRATALGIPIFIAPGYMGTCSDNPQQGTWRDRNVPLAKRWKSVMGRKGAPPSEWLLYVRRHYGWRAPLYALSPYLKTLLAGLLPNRLR